MKSPKSKYQIIPVENPKLGIVYKLTEGNTTHGIYASPEAANNAISKINRLWEEMKVIRDSENVEFEVEL